MSKSNQSVPTFLVCTVIPRGELKSLSGVQLKLLVLVHQRRFKIKMSFCLFLPSELDKANDGLSSSENRSRSLGNTGLLSLDPAEDRTALYDKLLETYDWHEKVINFVL